jgi:hypothetical protein
VGGWVVHVWGAHLPAQSRKTDLALLLVESALWLLIATRVLVSTGSALPKVIKRRLGIR